MKFAYIGIFGLLGVFARYFAGIAAEKVFAPPFPYGTFLVNMVGAFVIGLVYVLGFERSALSDELSLGIMVGFLGGFTTFSSYSLQVVRLIETAEYRTAAFYFVGSPILGCAAAAGGIVLARRLWGAPV